MPLNVWFLPWSQGVGDDNNSIKLWYFCVKQWWDIQWQNMGGISFWPIPKRHKRNGFPPRRCRWSALTDKHSCNFWPGWGPPPPCAPPFYHHWTTSDLKKTKRMIFHLNGLAHHRGRRVWLGPVIFGLAKKALQYLNKMILNPWKKRIYKGFKASSGTKKAIFA